MGLNDCKITNQGVSNKGVIAEAGTRLTGTAEQNKAVFDRLVRELVATCVNGLIDVLKSTEGAGEIGASVEGLSGNTVHDVFLSVYNALQARVTQSAFELALNNKEDKTETAGLIKTVSFNSADGKFTFTKKDGSSVTIDTALEKVATNWTYNQATQSLVLTLADGTTQSISLSDFITENEFQDSDQIDFSVDGHTVTATIKEGSITDTMLSSTLISMLSEKVQEAAASASDAASDSVLAYTAKVEAEAAQAAAETAQTAAETAKGNAEAAQEAAETAQDKAEAAVGKTSYIGTNGNWYEWDAGTEAFVDTGVPATGNCNFATFAIDPSTGMLAATYTTENSEIVFAINNNTGCLEVQIQ